MKTIVLFVVSTLLITAGAVVLAFAEDIWVALGLIGLGFLLELSALPGLLAWLRSRNAAR